jgi:hypothetical protein
MWPVLFHVFAMFVGVALTVGVGIHFHQVVQSGNVQAIRVAARSAIPLATGGGVLLIAGALLGLVAALQLGYPLTARWLVVTYVVLAALILDGFLDRIPWMRSVQRAAQASTDDKASPELTALGSRLLERISGPVSGLLWFVIVAMMVLKP